jgi:hypothetical protein
MNGILAQSIALACHANAFLRDHPVPQFFPQNSTSQFCDSIRFLLLSKSLFGKTRESLVASNPNAWFDYLRAQKVVGVRICHIPRGEPGFPDRMSAAFVGGGGSWAMETLLPGGRSAIWHARWEVWNREAPERRIWRVSYGRVSEVRTEEHPESDLNSIANRLRKALTEIYGFAQKHDCGGLSTHFTRALETLDSGGMSRNGFYKDLTVAGTVPQLAADLLDAGQSAWVFGGMGSWNDLVFTGAAETEYDRVSEQLFNALNEAFQAAANASFSLTT